jgi:Ni/Co efflux regulator RcnB
MMRRSSIALLMLIGVPTLAAAQAPQDHHGAPPVRQRATPNVGAQPHGVGPHQQFAPGPGHAVGAPIGHGVGAPVGRVVGAPGHQFTYHGRPFNRVHLAPFVYPNGWAYRRWAVGAILPPLFLAPAYYYTDWATLGLEAPQPGFQWVRYGPDLLLVNVTTGAVVDVVPDAVE